MLHFIAVIVVFVLLVTILSELAVTGFRLLPLGLALIALVVAFVFFS